jgi:uncharacterized protein YjbJ (UPF0337 family)
MSGKKNQLKGRGKEALGSATGNKDLESEGRAERQAGQVEETIDHVKGKIVDFVDKGEVKAEETANKIREARK